MTGQINISSEFEPYFEQIERQIFLDDVRDAVGPYLDGAESLQSYGAYATISINPGPNIISFIGGAFTITSIVDKNNPNIVNRYVSFEANAGVSASKLPFTPEYGVVGYTGSASDYDGFYGSLQSAAGGSLQVGVTPTGDRAVLVGATPSAVVQLNGGYTLTLEQFSQFVNTTANTSQNLAMQNPTMIPAFIVYEINKLLRQYTSDGDKPCFLAGTPISLPDGSQRPIEEVKPGDSVLSYDLGGILVAGRVSRFFETGSDHVLNLHGLMITPGHATLCGDGPHAGWHRPIMDILKDDGAIVAEDGALIRAATNCPVGSAGDRFVEIQIVRRARDKETGEMVVLRRERGRVRSGTRFLRPDGSSTSFLEIIEEQGGTLLENGLVQTAPNAEPGPFFWAGPGIPRPEDYVLALSGLTLSDLYSAEVEGPIPPGPHMRQHPPRHAGMIVN